MPEISYSFWFSFIIQNQKRRDEIIKEITSCKESTYCLNFSDQSSDFGVLFIDSQTTYEDVISFLHSCTANNSFLFAVNIDRQFSSQTLAWELLKLEFQDVFFYTKSVVVFERVIAKGKRLIKINKTLQHTFISSKLVGKSRVWIKLLKNLIEAAIFSNSNILILGESGTGKENLSRLFHELNPLTKGSLLVLDCSTISPELSGSEFYGHEKGAFTSAYSKRIGAFALANEGTVS